LVLLQEKIKLEQERIKERAKALYLEKKGLDFTAADQSDQQGKDLKDRIRVNGVIIEENSSDEEMKLQDSQDDLNQKSNLSQNLSV
jgi:hypothetical protein